MALGTNVEYKARALFSAALDEKSAKQVESRFIELSKKASDMSREEFQKAFSLLGEEINKSLAKLKMPPIDIRGILSANKNADAFSALGTEFGKSFNEGLEAALMQSGQIDKILEMKRKELESIKLYKANRRFSAVKQMNDGDAFGLNLKGMHVKDFSNMETESISQYMDSLYANIEQTAMQLQKMESKAGSEEYRAKFIKLENIIAAYIEGIGGLSNILELSNNPKYSIDELRTLTSKYGLNSETWKQRSSTYRGSIEQQRGSVEYTQMMGLIDTIQQLEVKAQFATKSIQDINNVLATMSSMSRPAQKKMVKEAELVLDGDKSSQVGRAFNQYQEAKENGADWVTLNSKALRFLNSFNAMDPVKQAGADRNWRILAEQLNPMIDQMTSSLKMFVDAANRSLYPGYGEGTGGTGTGTGGGSGSGTGTGTGVGDGVGVTPEEVENANKLAEVIQRVEAAYRELDALSSDPWNIKNEEEVNRILQERLAIIQRVGAENLKAHNPDAYADVEFINNEYTSKLDSFKQSRDDDIYNQLDENFGYNNEIIESSQNLEVLLAKRKELMRGIHFDTEQEYAEQEQINQAIERRIALMKQLEPLVANGSISQSQMEDMVFEQGDLDERRSALDGIQQDLFNLDSDSIDDAQFMLDQYEKIMVETASGKKLTLGPEMSEADWKAFMRMDTEKAKSIEFTRKEIQAHQENTAAINSEAQAQEHLNGVEGQNPPAQDDSGVHNANADALENEAQAAAKAAKEKSGAIGTGTGTGTGTGGAGVTTPPTQTIPDGATSAEAGELEAIRAKVVEVTNAVNEKTQAFFAEQKAVKSITQSEVHALGEVEKKVTAVRVALNNLQTKQHKINLAIAGGEDISNITSTEMDALTKLRAALQLVTKRVNEKTQAFEAEKTVVANVVSSEINALNRLNAQVGTVNTTIMNLLTNIQTAQTGISNIVVPQAQPTSQNTNTPGQGSSGGSTTSPQLFNAKVDTQFSSLSLMYAQLESVGKLTPQIEQQWLQLWDSLSKVNDTSSLQLWREELAQVRNAMQEIMIANDLVEKEGTQSFQQLIAVTKLYNQMLIASKKAKTPEARGAYEQEANAALVEQLTLLKNITLTKEQQAQLDELENERIRQINLIQAQQTGRERQVHDAQVEAEVVRRLVKLYEQLGRAQFLGNAQDASAIRQQIGTERANLGSVDYATDMKFMHAKEEGYNSEQTKAENVALKEQAETIKKLNRLYQEYGVLTERASANKGTNLGAEVADQVAAKEAEIQALLGTLKGGTTPEMQQGFDAAFDKGKAIESRKQYEAMARKSDQDEISRRKTIEGLEKEIGSLRAKMDNATNDGVRNALEQEIQLRKDLIALQEQGLAMDTQDEAYYRQMYALKTKQAEEYAKESQKDSASIFNEKIKKDQQRAGVKKSEAVANTAYDTLVSAGQIQGISPEQQANLDAYRGKIETLRSTIDSFPKDGLATEAQKNQLIAQRLEVDNYTREIQELIANYERLSGPNSQSLNATSQLGLGASAEAYQKELIAAVQNFHHGKASIKGYDAETKTLTYTLKTGKGEFTQYTASIRQTDGALMTVRGTTTKAMGVFETLGSKIKQYSYYFTGSMMFMRVFSELKNGISIVKEIDSALTELKKVTDETEETYDKFLDTAAKTASKVGSTIKDVVSSTADWARLGYAMEDAHTLAESTQILMNVSEFDDVSKATDTLISSVQAFKYTAEESMDVVDILNTIGNNYAISTADLATSLTKSSGSLVAANGTLEEAVALTATANTIIQDADVVGTALKTVAMRLRGTSTEELEEEGLDTDGAVESKSKLQSKVKGLSGVDILTDTGAYKSTYQILTEIADVWESMNDMDQAALLELLAGGHVCPYTSNCRNILRALHYNIGETTI